MFQGGEVGGNLCGKGLAATYHPLKGKKGIRAQSRRRGCGKPNLWGEKYLAGAKRDLTCQTDIGGNILWGSRRPIFKEGGIN